MLGAKDCLLVQLPISEVKHRCRRQSNNVRMQGFITDRMLQAHKIAENLPIPFPCLSAFHENRQEKWTVPNFSRFDGVEIVYNAE